MKKDNRSQEERQKVAAKMRALRKECGLSVMDMSRRLGLSRSTYHGYENGTRYPSTPILRILNDEYDISIDWLLFDRGPRKCSQKAELERLRAEVAQHKAEYDGPTIRRQADIIETQKKELDHLRPVAELLNHHEQTDGSLPPVNQLKPEILTLVRTMHEKPRVYHELMLHYEKVKGE